jgi:hypothetical protein
MKTVIIMAVFSVFALNAMYVSSPAIRQQLSKTDSTEIYRNTSEAKDGTFKLKFQYPKTVVSEPNKYTWKKFNFKDSTQAEDYMLAVLNYFLSENPTLNGKEQEWFLGTSWFHAPGLAKSNNASGRESIHGLTKERTSKQFELHQLQKDSNGRGNWAIGFFNGVGAVTIGNAWKEKSINPIKFSDNSVCVKLLFTRASIKEVPYLANTLTWKANTSSTGMITNRTNKVPLNLIQLDIAVKDDTDWVFGTFVYNNKYKFQGKFNANSEIWNHLVPIGLMWSDSAKNSWISPKYVQFFKQDKSLKFKEWSLTPQQSVLNGIVDNPKSNCMQCHAKDSSNPHNKYDYSLQLAYGFNNFKKNK